MKKILSLLLVVAFAVNNLYAQMLVSTGSGGNYDISSYPGNFTGYYDGFSVIFRANHNNPASYAKMRIGAFAQVDIYNTAGNALSAGDIKLNQIITLVYDASTSRFQMVTTSGNVGGGAGISGSGTIGNLARFTSGTSLGNSILFDDGTNVGVGVTPGGTYKLQVNGRIGSTGINETSDQRYKKNIFPIENALQKVMQLQGVNYYWRAEEFREKNFVSTPQIGLIAQEVEKVIPQVVETDPNGYKAVEYSKLVALLIEAIKEQQKKIDSLVVENQNMKNTSSALTGEFDSLKVELKILQDTVDMLLKQNSSLKTAQK